MLYEIYQLNQCNFSDQKHFIGNNFNKFFQTF